MADRHHPEHDHTRPKHIRSRLRRRSELRRIDAGAQIMVIGLGRFGGALAQTLVSLGHEVLGVDTDAHLVQRFSSILTHTMEADATDIEFLRQIGAAEFSCAVVGIGTDVESSVLTTSALADAGVQNIWAKAITEAHGSILERVGAHHVVFPEREMGERVAHLVTGRMLDYVELDPGFALVETVAPKAIVGQRLGDSEIRSRFGLTVVCVKPQGGVFTYATPDTVIGQGDTILVAGQGGQAEAFAHMT